MRTQFFFGKPDVKGSRETPKCRTEDTIKMYLREVGYEAVHWFGLTRI